MTTTESIADQLQHMADWFKDHPYAQEDVLHAAVEKHKRLPQIVFHHVETLYAAFPGKVARKKQYQEYFIYTLESDGIAFEAWDRPYYPQYEDCEVMLGDDCSQ